MSTKRDKVLDLLCCSWGKAFACSSSAICCFSASSSQWAILHDQGNYFFQFLRIAAAQEPSWGPEFFCFEVQKKQQIRECTSFQSSAAAFLNAKVRKKVTLSIRTISCFQRCTSQGLLPYLNKQQQQGGHKKIDPHPCHMESELKIFHLLCLLWAFLQWLEHLSETLIYIYMLD